MALREGGNYEEMISGVEETPEPEKTRHSHPYLFASIGILIVLILCSYFFMTRLAVNPSNAGAAWGGAGGLVFGNVRRATLPEAPSAVDITRTQSGVHEQPFIPTPVDGESGFAELSLLLEQLLAPQTALAPSDELTPETYAFIPSNLRTIETPKTRTPAVSALFDYGNEVGTYVRGFEDIHQNMPQILRDHAEDRKNPDKIAAVRNMGIDLAQLGLDLLGLQQVPASVATSHKAYATSYRILGTNLTKIAESETDQEFLEAITAYNTSAEDVTKRFLFIVAIFDTNNVTFSTSDPGSMFMFNPSFGLSL